MNVVATTAEYPITPCGAWRQQRSTNRQETNLCSNRVGDERLIERDANGTVGVGRQEVNRTVRCTGSQVIKDSEGGTDVVVECSGIGIDVKKMPRVSNTPCTTVILEVNKESVAPTVVSFGARLKP